MPTKNKKSDIICGYQKDKINTYNCLSVYFPWIFKNDFLKNNFQKMQLASKHEKLLISKDISRNKLLFENKTDIFSENIHNLFFLVLNTQMSEVTIYIVEILK